MRKIYAHQIKEKNSSRAASVFLKRQKAAAIHITLTFIKYSTPRLRIRKLPRKCLKHLIHSRIYDLVTSTTHPLFDVYSIFHVFSNKITHFMGLNTKF